MKVRAVVKDTGTSPRKMRLIINLVRGKKVEEALNVLKFAPTPNKEAVIKVIKSAAANAENKFQIPVSDLRVESIFADKAPTMKRFQPRARGRVGPILKRSSHITVIVASEEDNGTQS
ncbi:MAG: 50S ribosomal protein L22 [Chloroflexota bacterium]